jgi:hypothetical protein
VELFICEMGKIYFCGSFAKHMTCIEVVGDGEVWDKAVGFSNFLRCCAFYLRELVGRTAFFPLNETFCLLGFFPSLVRAEPLLAAS